MTSHTIETYQVMEEGQFLLRDTKTDADTPKRSVRAYVFALCALLATSAIAYTAGAHSVRTGAVLNFAYDFDPTNANGLVSQVEAAPDAEKKQSEETAEEMPSEPVVQMSAADMKLQESRQREAERREKEAAQMAALMQRKKDEAAAAIALKDLLYADYLAAEARKAEAAQRKAEALKAARARRREKSLISEATQTPSIS